MKSEPKMFTESEVRKIVEEEIKKHLTVSGWAGAVDNGCGYRHVQGGASAYWKGKELGGKNDRPKISHDPI